jgi:cytochrome c-type biogenesis protein
MTLWLFAFGAGMLATVNPCGFAMLPAFLAYYLGDEDGRTRGDALVSARLAQGLAVGASVSAGFAGMFTAVGLLVAFGLRSLVGAVPWAAVAIGAVLVVLGLAMLTGRQLSLRLGKNVGPGSGRGYRRMLAFGAAYAVASLSCTLAVLLAVVAQATATANPAQLVAVFVAYGLGASTVLMGLTLAAALAKATVARAIRRVLPYATRLGGGVLSLSGLYLVLYWLPSLTGGGRQPSAVGGAADVASSRLTRFVEANQGVVAVVSVALVVAALLAVVALRRRRARAAETAACCGGGEAGADRPDIDLQQAQCCPAPLDTDASATDRAGSDLAER